MFEIKSKKTKGGTRPGAGRKKGSPNKKTAELQEAVAKSGITPLEYMLLVLRTSEDPKERMVAATAAAPYVHAKLSAVEVSGDPLNPLQVISKFDTSNLTDDQLRAIGTIKING